MVAQRGFTMIELLVVVAIMTVLSGMILAAIGMFGFGSKRERTNTVLATLRTALEMERAERGGIAAPAEHPLAGSLAPRLAFVRADGSTPLAASGIALRGVLPGQVAASQRGRVLAGNDLFADPRVPALYGLRRDRIGILGVPQGVVTVYRRLPNSVTTADDPDDPVRFPAHRHLEMAAGVPADTSRALEHLFGSGTVRSELAALGALTEPASRFAVTDFADPEFDLRVATDVAFGAGGSTRWEPGRLRDGTIPSGPEAGLPNWKPYRLPGLALYDAWGGEILFSLSANGGVRLLSAGRDGCFRWSPGQDGEFQTVSDADAPSGDDEDSTRDNLEQVVGD